MCRGGLFFRFGRTDYTKCICVMTCDRYEPDNGNIKAPSIYLCREKNIRQ